MNGLFYSFDTVSRSFDVIPSPLIVFALITLMHILTLTAHLTYSLPSPRRCLCPHPLHWPYTFNTYPIEALSSLLIWFLYILLSSFLLLSSLSVSSISRLSTYLYTVLGNSTFFVFFTALKAITIQCITTLTHGFC